MNYLALLVIIGAFWIGMAAVDRLFNLSRFGIEFIDVGLVWRTEKLNDFIDAVSQKIKSVWNIYAWAGVLFSSAGILFVLYVIAEKAYRIIISPKTSTAGVQFVIPGITIPFWYPMIALVIIIVAHELSHGIIARFEKIKLKSVGLMFLLVIPGAFVEPDEEAIKGARRSSRLKLYAAGSFANFIVGGLVFLLLLGLVAPALSDAEGGVLITNTIAGMPSENILEKGMIIQGVNGMPIKAMEEFSALMEGFKPGDTITLNTDRGNFSIKLTQNPQNPQRGYVGINIEQNYGEEHKTKAKFLLLFNDSLWWIYFLNINIGLMNLLPITFILDGGKMVKEYLEMIFPPRTASYVTTAIGVFCILLFIINILPGILR